jgi:hypothetical protein
MTTKKLRETNRNIAQRVWRELSEYERQAFYDGTGLGGMSARSYLVETHGERFNTAGSNSAWSHLVALSNAWKREAKKTTEAKSLP